MSTLREKIQEDLKDAMRAKDEARLAVLRMLQSSIRNKEISLRKGEDVALNDEQVVETIAGEIKKRKDSIEAYRSGSREDLAEKEQAEITVLEKYLPAQLTDDELEVIVRETVAELGEAGKNFGAVMGKVMAKVKGRADGSKASETVKKVLQV